MRRDSMSAKDNFAQAMKELLNSGEDDNLTKSTEEKKSAPSSFSSFSQPDSRPPKAPAPVQDKKDLNTVSAFGEKKEDNEPAESVKEPVEETIKETIEETSQDAVVPEPAAATPVSTFGSPVAAPQPSTSFAAPAQASFSQPTHQAQAAPSPSTQQPVSTMAQQAPPAFSDTVTVIAKGTTVVGDITTDNGMRIGGNIKGNLQIATTLELNGKIIGDIECEDAVITASVIRGNVTARNNINMDRGTTIVGDVSAKNIQTNGKIKGNLTVEERGHFESESILVGNLISGTVIIDEGAMLKGDIAITNAQIENITVEEPEFDIEI